MTGNAPLPMSPTPWFGRIMEWFNAPTYRIALDLLGARPSSAVLEIGFGSGRLLELLARQVTDIFIAGIDPTEAMVRMAAERRSLRALGDRIDLRQGTAESLPWEDGIFDAAAALHSFQFWRSPGTCATEIRRVLKPGGRFVLILRNHEKHAPDWLPNPISRSGAEYEGAVRLLVDSGFSNVQCAGQAGSSKAIVALT